MNRLYNLALFVLLLVGYWGFVQLDFKASVQSLLPTDQSRQLYQLASDFELQNILIVRSDAKKKAIASRDALLSYPGIEPKALPLANAALRDYIRTYRFYINEYEKLSPKEVRERFVQLHERMMREPFGLSLDATDPLGLFQQPALSPGYTLEADHVVKIGNEYFSFLQLGEVSMPKLYAQKDSLDSVIFSPRFYHYENPKLIKADINTIVMISTALLLLLYIYMIGNVQLLANTVMTLLGSVLFALSVLSFFYSSLSVFVIVFGVILCAVGVDYMFHHYLHGYYRQKKGVNRDVFFGFITTFITLGVLSFNDYTLIAQIAAFSALSLLYSYIVFSFLYPRIGFAEPKNRLQPVIASKNVGFKQSLFLISIAVIAASWPFIDFNAKISQLDYDNKKLKGLEKEVFDSLNRQDATSFVIRAGSIERLLQKIWRLEKNGYATTLSNVLSRQEYRQRDRALQSAYFKELNTEINKLARQRGFRPGYFENAYTYKAMREDYRAVGVADLDAMGFDLVQKRGAYYYLFQDGTDEIERLEQLGAVNINFDTLFQKGLDHVYDSLIRQGALVLCISLVLVLLFSRHRMLSLLYIAFPLACIALYTAVFEINIMMAVAAFAILALSIDYGIYVANSSKSSTKKAIIYSLITTFAGFGVLILSSVQAVFSLGIIAVLGIGAISVLLWLY
ncbi:MAG: hypothetical protein ACQERK_03160 [Campylobacterota bacterium]